MRWWPASISGRANAPTVERALASLAVDGASIDLGALVERRAASWRSRFGAGAVSLDCAVEPLTVVGVGDELALAVDALLSNALRYSTAGDRTCVVVRSTGDHAIVQVTDTGRGIPADELPRVFDRFYRGRLGPGRRLGGNGIGLAFVRNVARTHGGDVQAESVIGEGTCVTLALPLFTVDADGT